MHRVDLACSATLILLDFLPGPWPGVILEIRTTFLIPTPNPRNSITNVNQGFVPKQAVQAPAEQSTAEGAADEIANDSLGDPHIGIDLGSLVRFASACCTIEPLIERFEPCVWWKLRNLADFVLCHASPLCVAPAEIQGPS